MLACMSSAPLGIPTTALLAPLPAHEHGWVTESAHISSTGRIVYVRCAGCGVRRVDAVAAEHPPTPLSAVVAPRLRP